MADPHNSLPERDLSPAWLETRRAHLVQELTVGRAWSRGRAVRVAVALAAGALLLALVGFGGYKLTREPTHVVSIGCYDRADVDASVSVISNQAADPVGACATLWRAGHVRDGTTRVPALTPCMLETGAVAVLPGEAGVCKGLGLASLSAEGRRRLAQMAALNSALDKRLGTGSGTKQRTACVDEADARRLIRHELEARGLDGWEIELVAPFKGAGQCAYAWPEPERRIVKLVGLER